MTELRRYLAHFAPQGPWLVLAAVLLAVAAAVPGLAVVVLSEALDAITTRPDSARLGRLALIFGGLYAVGGALTVGRTALTKTIAWRVTSGLRRQLHAAYLRARPGSTGERLARLTTEVDELQYGVSALVTLFRNPLTLLGLGATAAWLAPSLVPWALLIVPVAALVTRWGGRRVRTLATRHRDARAEMLDLAQQQLLGLRTVQEHAAEPEEAARFAEADARDRSSRLRLEVERVIPGALVQATAAAGVAALLWLGGQRVVESTLEPGDLVGFVVAMGLMARPLSGLSEVWSLLQRSLAALEKVHAALEAVPAAVEPGQPVPVPEGPLDLRWDAVGADYGNGPVLDGVMLEIPATAVLALVGPSGGGKSTLLRLVGRHIEPAAGTVELGGVDVRHLRLADLRRAVAVVGQEAFLFSRTVAENVALGRPDADRAAIEMACRAAGVHEVVEALPDGYDTRLDELGRRLSGGERQRLTVARALLTDARVLLLDEPTNQLDAATERAVLEALEAQRGRRTVVLVAHHLAAVQGADRIALVANGGIAEQGTHEQLLALDGHYARLWETQRGQEVA